MGGSRSGTATTVLTRTLVMRHCDCSVMRTLCVSHIWNSLLYIRDSYGRKHTFVVVRDQLHEAGTCMHAIHVAPQSFPQC